MLTAVNATASTAISTLRAARSARRFGWALSTFLLNPLSNSDVRKMATKIANRHASAPPLKRELPTRDSADRFCTSDPSAAPASAVLFASEKPTCRPSAASRLSVKVGLETYATVPVLMAANATMMAKKTHSALL